MKDLVLIGFKPLLFKLDRLTPIRAPHSLQMNSATSTNPMQLELCDKKGLVLETWNITTPQNFQAFLYYTTRILIQPEPTADIDPAID